jgi:AP endonuclease-1
MLYLGAHVSAAGKVGNAFKNAQDIGANAFALFVRPQRTWTAKPLSQEDIRDFKERLRASGIETKHILPHGSYLINLCNPDSAKWQQSYQLFQDEVGRCQQLGLCLYNMHPGSTVGACPVNESIGLLSDAINQLHKEVPDVVIVLENSAGQGNSVGSKFEELRKIIDRVKEQERIGVCLDTCHLFAAGYDIRSEAAYQKTMRHFDETIGFGFLRGIHLNDSKAEFNSGLDRHENIGKGHIGIKSFQHFVNDSRLRDIPLVLETPAQSDEIYSKEIELLRSLVK